MYEAGLCFTMDSSIASGVSLLGFQLVHLGHSLLELQVLAFLVAVPLGLWYVGLV